jgi:alkylated DNA repair dioxygenase AlkB
MNLPACFALSTLRTPPSFNTLHSLIAWQQETISLYGKTLPVPRLTAMYGKTYTYSGIQHPEQPLPQLLDDLRRQVETTTGYHFNSVLCNLYRNGSDSVSWHSDDDYGTTNPTIASLSFGATRRFRLRTKDRSDSMGLDLTHGSLLTMGGTAQRDFDHCITKTKRIVGPRINLTFRLITP